MYPRKKRAVVVLAATVLASGLSISSAAAGAKPAAKSTGSITLAGIQPNSKYLSYDAFQTSPVKGSVSYTDFDYPTSGSGVWVPDDFNMGFGVDPDPAVVATYSQDVASWQPTSQNSVAFSGTGATSGWLSTFTGSISGSQFNLSMTEINALDTTETYALTAAGSVAPDGSVTGTWSDNYGVGRTGTFVIGTVGHEVLHYVASVSNVTVSGHDAYFQYPLPAPFSGLTAYWHVVDGGSSGASYDHVYFDTSPNPTHEYTITSGNLTVFS